MKVIIIGGVAGGASAAARLRRLDEQAEIILVERGESISYANCGLPYHLGNVIPDASAWMSAPAAKRYPSTGSIRKSSCVILSPAVRSVKLMTN